MANTAYFAYNDNGMAYCYEESMERYVLENVA